MVFGWGSAPRAAASPRGGAGNPPLFFEMNRGQFDRRVKFAARRPGHTLFLSPSEAVLLLRRAEGGEAEREVLMPAPRNPQPGRVEQRVLRIGFMGASPAAALFGMEELSSKSNYLLGADPKKWTTHVPHFARVKYEQIYRGIDLVFYGSDQLQPEFDFVVSPGAEYRRIKLKLEGAEGLKLEKNGDLMIELGGAALRQRKPVVYQVRGEQKLEVRGNYVLSGAREVSFEIGAFDPALPLVIDPVLEYSTYLGGEGEDQVTDIALDSAGNSYVTGSTFSQGFPVKAPLQPPGSAMSDGFISKFGASGRGLIYSTYLGGAVHDGVHAARVDREGRAYVAGYTYSLDFPTERPFQPVNRAIQCGYGSAFVSKLSPGGDALVYSSYLGGRRCSNAHGIAVDGQGSAYVVGATNSGDFPTGEAGYQPCREQGAAAWEAFAVKLSPDGQSLTYSTCLGGARVDGAKGIALDEDNQAYVLGDTLSTDFPTVNPIQGALAGSGDFFVAKLSAAGDRLLFSTYLGGSSTDTASEIAAASPSAVYIAGYTYSSDFPTRHPFQVRHAGGGGDAVLLRLDSYTSSLVYSSYLGGKGVDFAYGIAADADGTAWVVGQTNSDNFPLKRPLQSSLSPGKTGFVAALDRRGALRFSTYFGGSSQTSSLIKTVAIGSNGRDVYFAGTTDATSGLPLRGAFQGHNQGDTDGFAAKLVERSVFLR
jgi:hypothetical protein